MGFYSTTNILRFCCLHCQGETFQTRVVGSSEARYISIKLYWITAQKTVTIKSNMLPECWYRSPIPHAITPIKCKLNIYCCEILSLRSSFGLCESNIKSTLQHWWILIRRSGQVEGYTLPFSYHLVDQTSGTGFTTAFYKVQIMFFQKQNNGIIKMRYKE